MTGTIEMLTECQKIILTCLLGPEDPTAFARERKRAKNRRYFNRNREANRVRSLEWRKKNPEKYKASVLGAQVKNPEYYALLRKCRMKEYRNIANKNSSAWYYRNKKKARAASTRIKKLRYRDTPAFRLECICRARIAAALKRGRGVNSARTVELLGLDLKEFRIYIQGQFRPGMTWENHGSVWHVDHIKPCAKFDLTDPAQQRDCFHWSNLQPLFAEENLKKGAR